MLKDRINREMKKQGVTLYRISKDVGVPYNTLKYALESGRQLEWLDKLLKYLDIKV